MMEENRRGKKIERTWFGIIITLLILLTTNVQVFAAEIIIEKDNFRLSETVNIELKGLSGNEELQIFSESGFFKFSGELKNKTSFRPREIGEYTLRLTNGANTISEKKFIVSKTTAITTNNLKTDKKEYLPNEEVIISIENPYDEELQLNIIAEESYKYLGKLESQIKFTPNKIGKYTLELRKNFIAIATAEFEVKQTIKVNRTEQITQTSTTNALQNNSNLTNTNITNNTENAEPSPQETTDQSEYQSTNGETTIVNEEFDKKLPFKLQSINTRKISIDEKITEITNEDTINKKYDVKIKPKYSGVKNIEFRDLKVDKDLSFDFDEVKIRKEDLRNHMKNKNSLKSFFIDTGALNYTNGTITATAVGTELWKCKLWNKVTSVCDGSWEKVMNLIPGQDYEILIYPEDPGYTETGIATINTKKPIYHPGEKAEFIMVVLDTNGFLVSNANVNLTITTPNNNSILLTSQNGDIIETSKGIYEASFITTQEGNYELFVEAKSSQVNHAMHTTFEVKDFYEFDIIRQTPVTIDPWLGPFRSTITINPLINITSYDFTEIIPSEFIVTDNGGASVDTIGNSTFLTWTGLSSNSQVSYSAQAPLVTPDLYLLGKAIVTYFDNTNKVFTESRNWLLAIDPATTNLLPDQDGAYTNWAISGSTPESTRWNSVNDPVLIPDDGVTFITSPGSTARNSFGFENLTNSQVTIQYVAVRLRASRTSGGTGATMTLFYRENGVDYDNAATQATTTTYTNYSLAGWNYTTNPATNTAWTPTDVNNMEFGLFRSAGNRLAQLTSMYITVGYSLIPNITNLSYPQFGANLTTNNVTFNFTVTDDETPIRNCSLWGNFSGTWGRNTTIGNVANNTVINITLNNLVDGAYSWNINCTDIHNGSGLYQTNGTVNIEYLKPPRKTIVNIDSDYISPWTTINRNPFVNVSLNRIGACRISLQNESYAQMIDNIICLGAGTNNANCTYTGTPLTIGVNTLFIACNSTAGVSDTNLTSLALDIDIMCDSHADCSSGSYCDLNQDCTTDVIPGYACNNLAYTSLSRDNVCGDGSNAYCVNDSTYTFTGWYCTDSTTDCVYNNNGNSYDLGYELCAIGPNDYKTCSSNNEWSSLVDCAENLDPANQTATTHTGGYCGYFASAQTCTNGTNGGCAGEPTDCGDYIYNLTTQTCGNVLSDCDLGCGSVCDSSNSTTAGIISNICYYDKSCSNACGWSQVSETAPDFCINDNDGGICAFTTRTNPNTTDTCYSNPTCANTVGAGLSIGTSNNLRLDYCDFCNINGNQSGQYSPAPNASCSSNCEHNGTLYYDNATTPNNRSDDCSVGITRILTDTLTFGDIWNGSGPAFCENTECDLDCGTLYGACNSGVCECSDQDVPHIIQLSPTNNTWRSNATVPFIFNVTDISSEIANCSLIINSTTNLTNTTINESQTQQIFFQNFVNGSYSWAIRCIDNSINNNTNTTSNLLFGIDTLRPYITGQNINGTNFSVNQYICLNATITDVYSGVALVLAEIQIPGQNWENVSLSDTTTNACDGANGNNVYSASYQLTFGGTINWTTTYAFDNAGNQNISTLLRSWNVTVGGRLNTTMNTPVTNRIINESGLNNNYIQNCTAQCTNLGANCTNVNLFLEYRPFSEFIFINTTSTGLFTTINSFACQNLTVGQNCTNAFSVTSASESGNNTWSVRCGSMGDNSATSYSQMRNITINDKPIPNITNPVSGTWLSFIKILNSSLSFDNDGNITNRTFEYDNNTQFTSPTTICSTNQSNCTWNTTTQNQCQNNSMSCYLRLTVFDNLNLNNSQMITIGFDTNGPTTILDLQRNFSNITTNTALVNASATDNEVGIVSTVIFEYRQNSTSNWANICQNTTAPYTCTWNLTNLPDARTYEIRAYANDTLENIGVANTHTNITIDRNSPNIILQNPADVSYTNHTTIAFQFLANDTTSEIRNCTLIIDSVERNWSNSITEDTTTTLSYGTLSETTHSWNITCFDMQNNQNTSFTRTFTIDITGPTTTLDLQRNFANITGANNIVNATASDSGIGTINQTIFEYRQNNTANWNTICTDSLGPIYNCTWNTISLTDSNTYELRAQSRDALENNGTWSINTNITIDNNPPNITLVSPTNQTADGDGSVIFSYFVNNEVSQIRNCSLILQGTINQTQNAPINVGQTYSFTVSNMSNGIYNWTINCTDSFNYSAISYEGQRQLAIDVRFVMKINVTSDNTTYEAGNQQAPNINATNNITDLYNQSLSEVTTTTDIILTTNKTEQHPAWWNISWEKRKAIYISISSGNNMTDTRVVINITGLTGNITSCANEIRIATTTGQDLPRDILSGDNVNYCEVAFLANISASANNENKYFAYYNNSGASAPSQPNIAETIYRIFTEDFEGGGWTQITTNDPATQCAGGFGNFNNCTDFSSSMDFATTTASTAEISGTRIMAWDQSSPFTADQGVYHGFSALNACGGDRCDDIRVTGYVAISATDSAAEFARIWVRNTTTTAFTQIYQCSDATTCEFSTSDVLPTLLTHWTFFNQTLRQDLGVGFTNTMFVHIAFVGTQATDNGFFEDINITGTRKQAPNITNVHLGTAQKWIERKTNITISSGLSNSIFTAMNKTFANYSISTQGQKTNYTTTYNFTFIEIKKDSTPPRIILNSPANMSESNSSVTFTYIVNDTLSDVLNCTLLIDFAPTTTSANPTEGPVQFFFPRVPSGGWHNWSVNCTDFYNNTGASEAWQIYIAPPDLFVNNSEIHFNNTNPKEGDNITINATMRNIGGSDAYNATLQFYLEDPDLGGIQIGENITISLLTDQSGNFSNITLNTTWIVTGPGPFNFFAIVDPPTATNGSIFELYETNNKANNTLNVPAYQYFYGNVTTSIYLGSQNNSIYYYLNVTNVTGNIFVTGESNTLSFSNLQAMGRNTSNTSSANDFLELDTALNMSNFNDSNSIIYTGSTGIPLTTRNMSIFNKTIRHVPIINSTNTTNFMTGILWDTNDGGNEYDGTQDIAYVTNINYRAPGRYGTYDYEVKVPAPLENHKGSTAISFYWEINT